MKISVTGASGFVGRHLVQALTANGHTIVPVGRHDLQCGNVHLCHRLAGSDAVINLAGAPINRRWSETWKQQIRDSRIETTRLLVEAMGQLDRRPQLFISTSAIGAYDDRGHYTEADAPTADDFLGRLSRDWEYQAGKAQALGIRTLITRFGLVLGRDGGLMKQLLLPFRMGLGGPVGDGRQAFSWIHIQDLVRAQIHLMNDPDAAGVFNLCAPQPVSNRAFSRALGRALNRPAVIPVPPLLLKLVYGEGAEVMLSGQSVTSARLAEYGFRFLFDHIDAALEEIVSSPRPVHQANSREASR